MGNRTCSEPGCGRRLKARGLCDRHWYLWRRSVGENFVSLNHDPVARFWEKVDRRGPDECWSWTASIEPHGYGHYGATYQEVGFTKAHRFAYHIMVGPIPDGLDLDHLCHTRDESCRAGDKCQHRRCVNPAHLEPVPEVVNILRGRSGSGDNARKTHCVSNHPFSGDNLRIAKDGSRRCKICDRESTARYLARKRNAA